MKITDDLHGFAETTDGNAWTLHYLMRGGYGNYLLGGPSLDPALVERVDSFGGVYRVLSFHETLPDDAQRWFVRFGCRWLVPDQGEELDVGPVPLDPLTTTPLAGLRRVTAAAAAEGREWSFTWRGNHVVAGFGRALAIRPNHSLALPAVLRGSAGAIKKELQRLSQDVRGVLPSKLLKSMARDRPMVCLPLDAFGLVVCFDDIHYERNDVEFIGPKQRRQLRDLLEAKGYHSVAGNHFRRDGQDVRISEPPRVLMYDTTQRPTWHKGAVTFVTATQGALEILLSELPVEERLSMLLQLAARVPVNIPKLRVTMKRRPELIGDLDRETFLAKLQATQDPAVAHYKQRKPAGLFGRIYEPRPPEARH